MVREPEWNARERSLMLAHFALEADLGPFGVPLSRAVGAGAYFEASPLPKRNDAVKAVVTAQDRYFAKWPDADRNDPSLLWSVREAQPPVED